MRNPNANERLRAEFFRQYGKPLERVRGVRAARGGSIHQLYRDSDGKLIRLRTSVDGVLVTNRGTVHDPERSLAAKFAVMHIQPRPL